MTLRQLLSTDAVRLSKIQDAAFGSAWSAADLAALIDAPSGFGFIAMAGDDVAAFILCRQIIDEAEILVLATHPASQRKGLGARLLTAAANQARQSAHTLFLEVAADNAPALSLYAKAGFVVAGRREKYYARPNGAEDAIVLRLDLNRPGAPAYGHLCGHGLEPPFGSH
jgi:ribosomal-protein-alanine N-acetyltransferase